MTDLQAMEEQGNAKFHKIPSACKVCLYICVQMCPCFAWYLGIGVPLVLANRGASFFVQKCILLCKI